jgi:hypothetical protein
VNQNVVVEHGTGGVALHQQLWQCVGFPLEREKAVDGVCL